MISDAIALSTLLVASNLASCSATDTSDPPQPITFIEADESHLPADFAVQSKDAATADIDGDGDLDLMIAVEYRANWLLINQGDGRFRSGGDMLPSVDRDSEDVALGDFDNDGAIDAIFASEDDRDDELYLRQGDGQAMGGFRAAPFSGIGESNAVIAADVNRDGNLDILLGNRGGVTVWIGDGSGGFEERSAEFVARQTLRVQDIELGDADGDGDLDMIIGSNRDNALYLADSQGRFVLQDGAIPMRENFEQTREADFADIDGDGDLDLYFANVAFGGPGDARDRLLINDGSGRFAVAAEGQLPPDDGSIMTMDADFVDIDADGDVDLALAGLTLSGGLAPASLRILLNDGSGNFSAPDRPLFAETVTLIGTDIEFADFNLDQVLDIYVTNRAGVDRLFFGQR